MRPSFQPSFRLCFVTLLLAVAVMSGCATRRPGETPGVRAIERLDLLLTSMALDLDGQPGADGFGARVYASNRRSAQGAMLTDGRLEIIIYDGVVRAEDLSKTEPLRQWSFPATELKPHLQKTSIGIGYRFALAWGEAKPRGEHLTVIARYVAPDGVSVQAAPGTIPLGVK